MSDALVTVGIPTYNRPEGLERTLQAMLSQTHRNLEIIVSDNASTDSAVERVVRDAMKRDSRVSYHRHSQNLGSMANFTSLLSRGNGEFFMWAADDDRWESFFIERCVRSLIADPHLAVCQMEAQYEMPPGVLFPFFFEGAAFQELPSRSAAGRIKHLLRYIYGNLVYGVFRRAALFHVDRPVTEWIGKTWNEMPMLILVAANGGIRVLPEVGMYKAAPRAVCVQARWERIGGRLPDWKGWRAHLNDCRMLHSYHKSVMRETWATIDALQFDWGTTQWLRAWATLYLFRHEFYMATRWKPVTDAGVTSKAVDW